MVFTIPGRPIGKRRPRVTLRGRRAIVYTPKESREYEERVAWEAKAAGVTILQGPVSVRIVAYIAGRRRADADNLAKSILDGLNGVAYEDDSQVVTLEVEVRRGRPERAEVEVREVASTDEATA